MRYPHLVILASDHWLAKNLRPLADEQRWLIREPRTAANALGYVREGRPGVLLVQLDLTAETAAPYDLIADAHWHCPDVPCVAVSDVKVNEADRGVWRPLLMDLGARYVLFPPLTRPVVEDVVSGLMAASIRRVLGPAATDAKPSAEGRS